MSDSLLALELLVAFWSVTVIGCCSQPSNFEHCFPVHVWFVPWVHDAIHMAQDGAYHTEKTALKECPRISELLLILIPFCFRNKLVTDLWIKLPGNKGFLASTKAANTFLLEDASDFLEPGLPLLKNASIQPYNDIGLCSACRQCFLRSSPLHVEPY